MQMHCLLKMGSAARLLHRNPGRAWAWGAMLDSEKKKTNFTRWYGGANVCRGAKLRLGAIMGRNRT